MSYSLDITIRSTSPMPAALRTAIDEAIDEAVVALHQQLTPGCRPLQLRECWDHTERTGWLRPGDDRDIDRFAQWAAALADAHPTLAVTVVDRYGTVFVQSQPLPPPPPPPDTPAAARRAPASSAPPDPLPEACGRLMLDDDWRPTDRANAGAHVSNLSLMHPRCLTSASYHSGGGAPIMVVRETKRMLDASGTPLRTTTSLSYPTHLSAPNYDYSCGVGYLSGGELLPGTVAMEADYCFGLETVLNLPVDATRHGALWTFRASPPLNDGFVIFGMYVSWFDADGQRMGSDTFLSPWEVGRYRPDNLVLREPCHGARSTTVRLVGARLDGPVHRFGWALR